MNTVLRMAVTFAAGAAIMYYLDPAAGRRRRSLVRDQAVSVRHDAEHYVRAKSKRTADRMQGALARTRARIAPQPVDDEQLRDRIRARLGHVVDRPSALEVEVREGHVVLSGYAAEPEIEEALKAVSAMHGVHGIENRLAPGDRGQSSPAARPAG